MRRIVLLFATLAICAPMLLGQGTGPLPGQDMLYLQGPIPPPPPPPGAGNVFFRTEKVGDKVTMGYFAIADAGKTVTNAPYSATSITETTQILADGNRIVNKSEALVARDGQGRTRREEVASNIGPPAAHSPKMVFITDPVAKSSYMLDLNEKTAETIKLPGMHGDGASPDVNEIKIIHGKAAESGPTTVNVEKRVIVGAKSGVEQRVWVNTDDASQVKTEPLGAQTIEGVSAEGSRTTRTIPAGEIGNERPIEIVSEVWTSPDLQMIVLSKRSDPRFGETVYKLTDIKRVEPDPSLFQVPGGFTSKSAME